VNGGWWSWSLRLGRLAGVEVRLHWSLMLLMAFTALEGLGRGAPWWWSLLGFAIPFVLVLLHEFGHITAARLVGGSGERIVMWALGGLAQCEVPRSPGKQLFVAAAGPLANLVLACLGLALLGQGLRPDPWRADGLAGFLLAVTTLMNLGLLAFNLIPAYPLDGGRILRALLWPLFGLRRAVAASLAVAALVIAAMAGWAFWTGQLFLGIIAIALGLAVLQEWRALRAGWDHGLGLELEDDSWRGQPWFSRWRAARARRREEARIRAEEAEQERLDALLAKVSAQGLASLSSRERQELEAISRHRRERV
jgi:Zn-dependent protease